MAKYVTKQREKLLACLTEQADKQITARQIAEILTADKISISAVYRNLAALEEEGILKRIVREGTLSLIHISPDIIRLRENSPGSQPMEIIATLPPSLAAASTFAKMCIRDSLAGDCKTVPRRFLGFFQFSLFCTTSFYLL